MNGYWLIAHVDNAGRFTRFRIVDSLDAMSLAHITVLRAATPDEIELIGE